MIHATAPSGTRIEKLSLHPSTGECLLIPPYQFHRAVRGAAPFADYVRVIMPHGFRLVAMRSWIPSDGYAGTPVDAALESHRRQLVAERVLRRHGAQGWTFLFNITNDDLIEITGRGGW